MAGRWKEALNSLDAKTKGDLVGTVVGGFLNLLFAALVAWAAIDGGPLGQGFAIFIVISNLRAATTSLAHLETATREGRKL